MEKERFCYPEDIEKDPREVSRQKVERLKEAIREIGYDIEETLDGDIRILEK
jgi:hypothetical protein